MFAIFFFVDIDSFLFCLQSRLTSVQDLAKILQMKGFEEAYKNHTDQSQPPPFGYNWNYPFQNFFPQTPGAPGKRRPISGGWLNVFQTVKSERPLRWAPISSHTVFNCTRAHH